MPDETRASMPPELRFERVLADLLQAEERGERPDISALLRRDPELEAPLRAFFDDRARFDRLAPRLAPTAAGRAGPPEPPPPDCFGGYAVLQPLGRGGSGVVYRVNDPELNRPLAVKVLRPELRDDPDAVRRFVAEAQVLGQLQHPGIVPVHGLGRLSDGRPYFAMKLVEGRTLAELLAERPSPADGRPRFLAVFQQVCQAVAYAHSRGVIHRDLKPANVMVGAFAEVQVMDWGLAKVLDACGVGPGPVCGEPGLAATGGGAVIHTARTGATGLSSADGLVVGTFAYMSPEQARGRVEDLDARADVFGLGALLCEVLTGRPPYGGAQGWELHRMAAAADLAEARTRLDGCGADAELIALAWDCLAVERARRPRDAGAVAGRLAAYLAEVQEQLRRAELDRAAAQARAEEARATARAERRARRLTLGLAVVVLAVLASLTAGGLWLQRQQAEQARQAEALRRDVEAQLARAVRFRQGAHFEASGELLAQARQRLGPDGPEDLRARVGQALADTALAGRLDAARLRPLTESRGESIDFAGTEKEYAAALKEAGLGREGEDPAVVAARVRASGVRAEVVAALDDWAGIAGDGPRRAWLLAVAGAAGLDPEENSLRRPELWRKGAALARLAGARVAKLSPQLVAALGRAVSDSDAIPLLRKALALHPQDFWLTFGLASVLSKAKRLDEAIGYYRAALALRPEATVHNNLGVALDDKGQGDEAIRHYREAFRIDPKNAIVRFNLGIALYLKGNLDEAVNHCREAVRLAPKNSRAHTNLGMALCAKGRLDEGIRHFRKALRIDTKNAKVHYNLGIALQAKGRLNEALNHCKAAVRLEPENAQAHVNLGNALQAKGLVDNAMRHYERAIRLDAKLAAAHTNLGAILYDQGKRDEAVRHWKKALRLDPKDAMAHTNLGKAAYDKGRLDEAVRRHKEAIRLDPKNALAHSNLGLALRAMGQLDKAIPHYRESLRLNPNEAKAHYNLGNALGAKGQVGEAIRLYREALRIDAKFAAAHTNLGVVLYSHGKPDEAIRHWKEALRLHPNDFAAHDNLGNAMYDKRQLDEAIHHWKEVVRLHPGYAPGHNSLAVGLGAKRRFDEAIACCRRALALDPKYAGAHVNLGNALCGTGKLVEAVSCYQAAIQINPKFPQAYGALGQALLALGRFAEARQATRRCLDLLPPQHPMRAAVTRQLQRCEEALRKWAGETKSKRSPDS
jgi:tetratricopeptide (TPR) repeat protein